ncbi:hypothetical protein BDZ89DRAFT_1041820 [Hymenopellis radicata]|nr:hypothetical protein BDZ89DRAFT_1041820 [Hymenopellis radicata]
MNNGQGRFYGYEDERFHRVLPSFREDLKQFSNSLLNVHHMTSGITERADFQYQVNGLFELFKLLVVLISNRLSRRQYVSYDKEIEPEDVKDLFLQMQNDMMALSQSTSPVFRFVMGWNVNEVLHSANTNTTVIQLLHPNIIWRHFHYMERYNRRFPCGKEVRQFYDVSTAVVNLHSKIGVLRRDGVIEGFWEGPLTAQDRLRGMMSALERAALKLAAIVVLQRQEHKGAAGPMSNDQQTLFMLVVLGVKSISTAVAEIEQSLKDNEKRLMKQRQRPAQRPTSRPSGHARGLW